MTLFQIIFGSSCALIAVWFFVRGYLRRGSRLSGLFWGLLWTGAAVTILRPGVTSELARLLGIGRGADLVMYFAILGGIMVTRYFYNRCRRLENTLTQLVRERAIQEGVVTVRMR